MPLPKFVNFFQNVPANPGAAATGSTAGLQCGYGVTGSFVPQSSGAALITISGTLANSVGTGTPNGGGSAKISMGAGPAPAAFASATGGAGYPAQILNNANTAAVPFPFTMTAVVNGLTVGAGYWIDMQIAGNGTGTITPGNIVITALEL